MTINLPSKYTESVAGQAEVSIAKNLKHVVQPRKLAERSLLDETKVFAYLDGIIMNGFGSPGRWRR